MSQLTGSPAVTPLPDEPPLVHSEAGAVLALRLAGLGTWEVACSDPTDMDRWPMQWSNEAYRVLGVDPALQTASTASLRSLVHPDDRAARNFVADKAWTEGRPYTVDYRIIRPDGSTRVITEQGRVFPESLPGRGRIVGVVQDITERRHVDQALRDYNTLLRGVTRAQASFIAGRPRQDAFGELLTCLLSYTGSEFGFVGERVRTAGEGERLHLCATAGAGWDIAARSYYDAHEHDDVPLGEWARLLDLDVAPFICNTADEPSASSDFLPGHPPVRNYMLLPFAHDEDLRGVIGLANAADGYSPRLPRRLDALLNTAASLLWALRANERRQRAEAELVTLNAELEARVRRRTKEWESANRELESFSYSVSHDLRAPLRGIDGWSAALGEDFGAQLPEKAAGYLAQLRSEVQRMGELIEDLLQLSRVTRVDLEVRDVDLTLLTATILEKLTRHEGGREIEIAIQPGVIARADKGLLRVVMQNLLDNAWKFTGKVEHPRIELGTLSRINETVYFVRDNGAGFDMSFAGKLFSPFRRFHRQSEFPGTGVGLATVQRIIHRHGGTLWAESEPGKGAAFFFTLAGET